jgi:predicted dehydrogenase
MRDSSVSRREFLGTAGASLAALPLATSVALADKEEPVRCAILGTGSRGTAHLRALLQTDKARVVALCDNHEGRLNEAAKLADKAKPQTFADWRKMLELKTVDAIFIATPCNLHKEMAVATLQSGRHCYCEKPIALTVPDLDELVKAAQNFPKQVFQTGLQLRYSATTAPTIKAVKDGAIGKPVLIRAHRYNTRDIAPHKKWFFDRDQSGDIIVEQAVHEFDMFNEVFGKVPERACGFGGLAVRKDPPRNIMDHYTLSLEYGPNERVHYSHCWFGSSADPYPGRQELVFGTEKVADLEKGLIHPREGKEEAKRVGGAEKEDPTVKAFDEFFRCIREGKKPVATVETGRDCVLTALLGRKAIYEGRVVTMKELLTSKG